MQIVALAARARIEVSCVRLLDGEEDLVEIPVHLGMFVEDVTDGLRVEVDATSEQIEHASGIRTTHLSAR